MAESGSVSREVRMRFRQGWVVLAMLLLVGGEAQAQVIGTFTWQTQPFCNRVTLTITQQGSVYQLTGSDDQCGAFSAPVYGTAVVTATGVNMAFSAGFGAGRTSHLTAVVSLATVSGTWADGDGTSGTFVFNGAATGGAVRPGPPVLSSLPTIPSGVTVTGRFSYDSHQPPATGDDLLYVALPGVAPVNLVSTNVNFSATSGASDADATCTGTSQVPTAPPGKVCVYVASFGGVLMNTARADSDFLPTRGFVLRIFPPAGTGDLYLNVSWAYTAP